MRSKLCMAASASAVPSPIQRRCRLVGSARPVPAAAATQSAGLGRIAVGIGSAGGLARRQGWQVIPSQPTLVALLGNGAPQPTICSRTGVFSSVNRMTNRVRT